jgi:hypothetical protein
MVRLMLAALTAFAALHAAEHAVRVRVVVVEPGGKSGSKMLSFSNESRPGPGKEIRVFVDAIDHCTISVVAFSADGQLVYGMPENIDATPSKTIDLPRGRKWTWTGAERLAEIDIVVAGRASSDYKAYSDLLGKMQQAQTDELRRLQAGALHRWLDARLKSASTAADYKLMQRSIPVAGLTRQDGPLEPGLGHELPIAEHICTVLRLRIPQ